MPTRPREEPADALCHATAKIAFIGDAFSQDKPFQFSTEGMFGVFLILRGIEDELEEIREQIEAKEVKA